MCVNSLIKWQKSNKWIVELIFGAKDAREGNEPGMSDISALEKAIEEVLSMLERVSTYVSSVIVR